MTQTTSASTARRCVFALVGGGTQPLAPALLVARRDPGPGREMFGGGEAAHLDADLGQDGGRCRAPDARDLHEAAELPFVGREQLVDLPTRLLDLGLQEVDEVELLTQQEAMGGIHTSVQRLAQRWQLGS